MSDPQHDPFRICGTTIDGKYRVLSVVGAGGFGVVYRGVHEGFGAAIAIKCLRLPAELSPAAQDDLVRQLRGEGRLLLQLSRLSSAIVQALDIGAFTAASGAKVPYLVLEWLDGDTLASHLRRLRAGGGGALSRREAIALLDPAARALAVAHAQRIAHRDIKPENLFLAEAGGRRSLKVLDFGIAKVLLEPLSPTEALAATTAGTPVLTPRYGAPEQFDRRFGATGPWTDVFALALVFVELVTGRPALEGDSVAALYSAAVDPHRRPTLRGRGAAAPEPVERVLLRALGVAPRERYPDAGAFWDALLAAEGVSPGAQAAATTAEHQGGAAAFRPPAGAAALEPTVPGPVDAPARGRDAAPGRYPDPVQAYSARPIGAGSGPAQASSGPGSTPASAPAATAATGPTRPAGALPWGAIAGLAAALAVGSGVAIALRRWDKAATTAPPVPTAIAAPTGDPAAPRPVSNVPEAATLYREALQAFRDGAPDVADRTMARAVAADRALSAGHLRLALWRFRQRPIEAREEFQLALRHRAALDARDAALLDAAEAYVRQPSDAAAWERRLDAAIARFPADPELLVYLGNARHARLGFDAAIEAYDRAIAADRGYVVAWVHKGESLGMKGDVAAELEAYRDCAETAPGATLCLSNRVRLLARQGDCKGVEEDARRWMSIDPGAASAARHLALALQARSAPRESVLLALQQSWTLEVERDRRWKELRDRAAIAALDGDFEQAVQLARDWQREVAGRTEQEVHASPALELARLYREMGMPREAGRVADDFLHRMSAWHEPATTGDWTIAFLPYSYHAASMTKAAFDEARAAWIARVQSKWRAGAQAQQAEPRWAFWAEAHAAAVETPEEAAEALRAIPADQPLPPERWRWLSLDLTIGKVYALSGKAGEAIAPLRRVARSCVALFEPFTMVQAHRYLGQALEASGDTAGAAEAYGAVVARWGRARPRSITADEARARLAALGKRPSGPR
ncbi:protein kinase domain-containing protein [Sorangium sp. So ce131]|uniref:protein kinase domain-containing protein n=1 Tax=Sorangium sp. So ce131 TaxID=3133282 RepID=UPI003F5E08A3